MSEAQNNDAAPFLFYCDMTAISPEERIAHQELSVQLFSGLLRETRELPDGYAYRFDGEHYPLLTSFIKHERLCCPFLSFRLEVAPHGGPLWLQLTAPGDVKVFLQEELSHHIPAQ
jgi:hypothetical protein